MPKTTLIDQLKAMRDDHIRGLEIGFAQLARAFAAEGRDTIPIEAMKWEQIARVRRDFDLAIHEEEDH
jgi:hypothetical protein